MGPWSSHSELEAWIAGHGARVSTHVAAWERPVTVTVPAGKAATMAKMINRTVRRMLCSAGRPMIPGIARLSCRKSKRLDHGAVHRFGVSRFPLTPDPEYATMVLDGGAHTDLIILEPQAGRSHRPLNGDEPRPNILAVKAVRSSGSSKALSSGSSIDRVNASPRKRHSTLEGSQVR